MDRHSAYVALSRHRDQVELHWAKDDLGDRGGLDRALSRERSKDSTLDYARSFALRREITPAAGPDMTARRERLAAQVARARGAAAQLAAEGKARRFAADWRQLEQRQEKLVRLGDRRERQVVTAKLAGMEARLSLDPALRATLRERHRQLGVSEGLAGRCAITGATGRASAAAGSGPSSKRVGEAHDRPRFLPAAVGGSDGDQRRRLIGANLSDTETSPGGLRWPSPRPVAEVGADCLGLLVRSGAIAAACPACGALSRRVQSRYRRRAADLPLGPRQTRFSRAVYDRRTAGRYEIDIARAFG